MVAKKEASSKISVTQVRSSAGRDERTKGTLAALGLGRVGSQRQHQMTPALQGMLRRVEHLIKVSAAE